MPFILIILFVVGIVLLSCCKGASDSDDSMLGDSQYDTNKQSEVE